MRLATTFVTLMSVMTMHSAAVANDALGIPAIAEPIQTTDIQSLTPGRIQSILVRDGQSVETDQLLIQLDDRGAQATVRSALANLNRTGQLDFAHAELEAAEQLWERIQRVNSHHAIARREFDAARTNVIKSRGNLLIAQEELEQARIKYEDALLQQEQHQIRTPFPGRISQIRASIGQVASTDDVMMRLIDISTLKLELNVPVEQVSGLVIGTTYQLDAQSPVNGAVAALLVTIDPVIDAGTQTLRCVFEIDNQDERLPAGFLVYPPSHWIPTSTITTQRHGTATTR